MYSIVSLAILAINHALLVILNRDLDRIAHVCSQTADGYYTTITAPTNTLATVGLGNKHEHSISGHDIAKRRTEILRPITYLLLLQAHGQARLIDRIIFRERSPRMIFASSIHFCT